MRRTAASLIALTLALLAGCSGGGADGSPSADAGASSTAAPTATAEDVAALEAVTLTGDLGAEPTFQFEQPFSVSAPVARLNDAGTGATIEAGQLITFHIAAVSGTDGTSKGTTYGSAAQVTTADPASGLAQPLLDTIIGQQVGMRALYAAPTDDDTLIWSVEVTAASPARAQGTPVAPAEGLPTVTLADDGEPSIETVDTDPPTSLVVQPLIQGTGPAVPAGATVTIHYSGWLWDGTAFDSSWSKGAPFTSSLTQLIQGWQQGLAGQPVGSQVLLVIPPDLGYGDKDAGSIPAGSTLIFVVDILAAS